MHERTAEQVSGSGSTQILQHLKDRQYRNTSSVFAVLLVLQWIGAIAVALIASPKTWAGTTSSVHVHVWAGIFLGGLITIFPVALALLQPTRTLTRHVVAAGQMLMGALLIHLTGGRVETHFHVFGSLAILAFYRDWRVLVTASLIVYVDHILRGIYWPQSVYGVLTASPWRAVEHAWWVSFEVFFLIIAIQQSSREMEAVATRQARLQSVNDEIEAEVKRQTAELRAVNKQMESFCYSMAHDLKAPLRSIQSFSEVLVQDHGKDFSPEAKDLMRRIGNAGNRMNELVDDLLEYSRITTDRIALGAVDLTNVTDRVLVLLAAEIQEKQAVINVQRNLGVVLGHDATLLQVMLNLVTNALKYAKLDTPPVLTIFTQMHGDRIRLSVQDNGIGIALDYHKRIFELFECIPVEGRQNGTGLGLAIVAKSMERLGGTFGLDSQPRVGSTFWFELPAMKTVGGTATQIATIAEKEDAA
jgi:signal transduction histidine kinase